jgi:hypothetical protein
MGMHSVSVRVEQENRILVCLVLWKNFRGVFVQLKKKKGIAGFPSKQGVGKVTSQQGPSRSVAAA